MHLENKLIEHYDSEIGKILTTHYNETSAVEMEGFGFANAASRQGRETSNIIIGVVRGISDILERENAEQDEKVLIEGPTMQNPLHLLQH